MYEDKGRGRLGQLLKGLQAGRQLRFAREVAGMMNHAGYGAGPPGQVVHGPAGAKELLSDLCADTGARPGDDDGFHNALQ